MLREMIERAQRGQKVVLLQYGDPLSSPGGSEEAVALAAAAVEWEIVPGIVPGIGVATYAGIPLNPPGVEPTVTLVHLSADCPARQTAVGAPHSDTPPPPTPSDTITDAVGPGTLPAAPPTAVETTENAAETEGEEEPPSELPENPPDRKQSDPNSAADVGVDTSGGEKHLGRSVIVRRRPPTSPGVPFQPREADDFIRILQHDLVELVDDPSEPAGTTIAIKKVGAPSAPFAETSGEDAPGYGPDWETLAHSGGTLVFTLEQAEALKQVVTKLLAHGRSPEEATALIESGTLNTQRTFCASLGALAHELDVVGISGPSVLIVGDGVNLREHINWFEERPLSGMRIALTDFADRAAEQARALEEKGAITFSTPLLLAAVLPDAIEALKAAVNRLQTFDMIIFSSPIPVKVFVEALRELGKDPRALSGPRLVAISTLTAFELARHGIQADMLIEESSTQWLVELLGVDPGDRILLPRAAQARDLLPLEIQQRGAFAEMIPVYELFADPRGVETLCDLIRRRCLDIIIHTSSSSVERLWEALALAERGLMQETIMHVAYGSLTARALDSRGLRVQWRLTDLTPERLVETIQARLASLRTQSPNAAPNNSEKALS